MRQWFPFTDYDFFGYLVSGMIFLFALDYAVTGGAIMLRPEWPFMEVVLALAVAYCAGQILATPSSIIVEHWLARKVFRPPVSIMLGDSLRPHETWLGRLLLGRNYAPIDDRFRSLILRRLATIFDTEPSKALLLNPDAVFNPAYEYARRDPACRERIDSFRNQYGLNRNLAFTGAAIFPLFVWRAVISCEEITVLLAVLSIVLSLGTLVRFFKFYCAFAMEVLRGFAFGAGQD